MNTNIKKANSVQDTQADVSVSTQTFNTSWSLMRGMVYFFGIVCVVTVVYSWVAVQSVMEKASNQAFVVTDVGTFAARGTANEPGSRRIEVVNHVKLFLSLMYAFDEGNFEQHTRDAAELIGQDGKFILNGYNQSGVLEDLIKTSGSVTVQVDSVKTDMSRHPYRARAYARQTVRTPAGDQSYNLVCQMELYDVSRWEKNIHGLRIENFNILDNSPINK